MPSKPPAANVAATIYIKTVPIIKSVGKDVVLLKYLYKCEKFPVVWYVAYYRDFTRAVTASDDRWVVISIRFDTQVEALGN